MSSSTCLLLPVLFCLSDSAYTDSARPDSVCPLVPVLLCLSACACPFSFLIDPLADCCIDVLVKSAELFPKLADLVNTGYKKIRDLATLLYKHRVLEELQLMQLSTWPMREL
jgi:hypothetical protein